MTPLNAASGPPLHSRRRTPIPDGTRAAGGRWGAALFLALAFLALAWIALAPPASGQPAVPELTGRVVDTADLLSASTERAVATRLRAHEDSTSNQIAVLTIASLEGAVLEDYALEVARTWELGQDDFDNGVLLLISRDDREMRIEVGYGLEGALPDVIASRIIRYEITPRFREGDFDGGVRAGVDAILGAVEGTYEPPTGGADDSPFKNRFAGLIFTVVGLIFGTLSTSLSLSAAARGGWIAWIFVTLFTGPFILAGGITVVLGLSMLLFGDTVWAFFFGALLALSGGIAYLVYAIRLCTHPKLRAARETVGEGKTVNKTITVLGLAFVPSFWDTTIVSSGSSMGGRSGGFSSGGFSSGGFSSGGGGFSGGGGSFGGGGASGGW